MPGIQRIAVIGGGPGGAQCARRLAEGGRDVTLFEPRVHFEKACGGGIPIRGLERFPFLFDRGLPGKEIRECLIVSPAGREARFPLRDPLYVFRRADLHTFMLGRAVAAGARWIGARIAAFENGARGAGDPRWILRAAKDGTGRAAEFGPFDFLVAAVGAAGPARRRLLLAAAHTDEISQGLGYYVPGISEEFITLKFYDNLHGYLWVFPRPDHSSAGICATLGARPAGQLRSLMDAFLAERYPAASLAASERYAALIPQSPKDPRAVRLQGEGWALVGDAARLVDPLTREGIYYAILSGEILAAALLAGRPEQYTGTWELQAADELAWAAGHGERFFDPRFIERLVFLCGRSPSIAGALSDLIAGLQSYRSLKPRLLLSAPRVGAELLRRAVTAPLRAWRDN